MASPLSLSGSDSRDYPFICYLLSECFYYDMSEWVETKKMMLAVFSLGLYQRAQCPLGLAQNQNVPFGVLQPLELLLVF